MTDGGLRVLAGVFWGFMLRCGGRYEGIFGGKHKERGSGKFTSGHVGWTYLFQKEGSSFVTPGQKDMIGAIIPNWGELVEADGRRFKVTFAKSCCFLFF